MADGRRLGGLGSLLRPEAWNSLVHDGPVRRFRAGAVMMHQGDRGGFVLALLAGRVKVTRDERDGHRLLLAVRGPGEILGDISVLDGRPRSATVTAIDLCDTVVLPAGRFRALMQEHHFSDVLVRHTLGRLREGEDRWAEHATLTAGMLVARVLLRFASLAGGPAAGSGTVDLDISQEDLARAVGLSRSAVAAELQRMRSAGVVRTARRRIVIDDMRALEVLAEKADGPQSGPE